MCHVVRWSSRLLAAALVAGVVLLLPTQLGGTTSLLSTVGNSMQPTMHQGDLVVLRAAPRYDVGDVVAYQSPTGQVFLHRIVARDGARFVLQGDNNDWLDSHRPTREEIIGQAWLHLPGAGATISWLGQPRQLAVLTLIAVFIAAGGIQLLRAKRSPTTAAQSRSTVMARRRRRTPSEHATSVVPPVPTARRSRDAGRSAGHPQEGTGAVLASLAAVGVAAALAAVAWLLPAERPASDEVAYTHTATFDYRDDSAGGPAYPQGLRSGDPVFRRVVDELEVVVEYELHADEPATAAGTYRIVAQLEDGNGWAQRLPLVDDTDFEGAAFSARATLDLDEVQERFDELEEATGVAPGRPRVAVTAEVTTEGTVGAAAVDDQFEATLPFSSEPLVLAPTGGDDGDDPLRTQSEGVARIPGTEANELSVGPLSLPVPVARWLAVAAIGLAGAGVIVAAWRRRGLASLDEGSRIERVYGDRLLAISRPPVDPSTTVPVPEFATLWRVAEHQDRMILHLASGDGHSYYVEDGSSVLAYHVADTPPVDREGRLPTPPADSVASS